MKHLIKLKSGRHRVATPKEAEMMSFIISQNTKHKDEISDQARMNARLLRDLRQEFDINDSIAKHLAKEFGEKILPLVDVLKQMTDENQLASFGIDRGLDVRGYYQVRTGVIPEIRHSIKVRER